MLQIIGHVTFKYVSMLHSGTYVCYKQLNIYILSYVTKNLACYIEIRMLQAIKYIYLSMLHAISKYS
jgi:hypothetical protein